MLPRLLELLGPPPLLLILVAPPFAARCCDVHTAALPLLCELLPHACWAAWNERAGTCVFHVLSAPVRTTERGDRMSLSSSSFCQHGSKIGHERDSIAAAVLITRFQTANMVGTLARLCARPVRLALVLAPRYLALGPVSTRILKQQRTIVRASLAQESAAATETAESETPQVIPPTLAALPTSDESEELLRIRHSVSLENARRLWLARYYRRHCRPPSGLCVGR